jgi:hypothetical protein
LATPGRQQAGFARRRRVAGKVAADEPISMSLERIDDFLSAGGRALAAGHGDREQRDREEATHLAGFSRCVVLLRHAAAEPRAW